MAKKAQFHIVYFIAFGGLLILSASVVLSLFLERFEIPFNVGFGRTRDASTLVFFGDIMLGRGVETLMDTHGEDYPFLRLRKKSEGELWIANFEAAMAHPHVKAPPFTFLFSIQEQYTKALFRQGFDVLSLANNHSYDYGGEGFERTKNTLKASGARVFGSSNEVNNDSVVFLDMGGESVALVGIHTVYGMPETEAVLEVLAYAKEKSDMQIVYIHWGIEYELVHENTQEQFAKFLIDNGVDAIVGHHPHVVQDIGMYKGAPIFYSLGNFIFDQYFSSEVMEGLTLSLEKRGAAYVWTLLPVTSKENKAQPRLMTEEEKIPFLKALAERSDVSLTEQIKGGEIHVVAND
jgi:poly-gamma-glutamate synthesis protein (capsule biosynthesis protein)